MHWTELQTDNQSDQRNISGTVTLFCDWPVWHWVSGNRFECETGQIKFSEQMKHAAQGNLEWCPGQEICSIYFFLAEMRRLKPLSRLCGTYEATASQLANLALKLTNFTQRAQLKLTNLHAIFCLFDSYKSVK